MREAEVQPTERPEPDEKPTPEAKVLERLGELVVNHTALGES